MKDEIVEGNLKTMGNKSRRNTDKDQQRSYKDKYLDGIIWQLR